MLGTPTDPALLAAVELAAKHIMTPAEQHAQRRSWVIGQMGLSRPDTPRAEIEALVDRALGPASPKVETPPAGATEAKAALSHLYRLACSHPAAEYAIARRIDAEYRMIGEALDQLERERDAAIRTCEMAATSGAFWARRAETAEARAARAEAHNGAQALAQAFATRAHADQKDKAGLPYTGHLVRVAARAYAHAEARALGPEIASLCVQAGWLHDTIEDTATTLLELTAEGFDLRVVGAVERLTRPCGVPYLDWIRAIIASGDTVAMIVKLADNEDNADPARQAVFPVPVRLLDRYEQSAALLREALS